MKIKVLLFGVLAEKAGESKLTVENIKDIESLKEYMFTKFPDFKNLTFQISINQSLIHENMLLKNGDEVAFLPPFAGG
ncbi:MAG: MoaD/ThiS family protein [Bacteroidales bacterium]|nr:MoaD/ThiS family protein [Bacteroidales bacterium]